MAANRAFSRSEPGPHPVLFRSVVWLGHKEMMGGTEPPAIPLSGWGKPNVCVLADELSIREGGGRTRPFADLFHLLVE